MSKLAKLNQFKRYLQNNAGSIAPIFAAAAVPFFLVAGAAIDMTRVSREQVTFFNSVDSAALAIAADDRAAVTSLTPSEKSTRIELLKQDAIAYIQENYSKDTFRNKETDIDVTLDIDGTGVKMTASAEFPTTFMSLVGVNSVKLGAETEVKFGMRPIELVMVLDTSGTMTEMAGSKSKIEGVRTAGKELLDTLYAGTVTSKPNNEDLRVAVVPFAGAVKLDTAGFGYDASWIDTAGNNPLSKLNFNHMTTAETNADTAAGRPLSNDTPAEWNNFYAWSQMKKPSGVPYAWNGCVEARKHGAGENAYHLNDTPPGAAADTRFPAYFNPDTYGGITATTTSSGASTTSTSGYSYIPAGPTTATSGNECAGLTATECPSSGAPNATGNLRRQENYKKYLGTTVTLPANETSPLTSTNIKFAQYVGPWGGCAINKIVPLTHNRKKVEDEVVALRAHGITVIPEGLAWGLRVLSPTEPFSQAEGHGITPTAAIAPLKGPRWQKVMVMMTDGNNNVNEGGFVPNNSGYSAYGFVRESTTTGMNRFNSTDTNVTDDTLDTNMLAVCQSIKDQEIELYVTAFGTNISTTMQNNLKLCATNPTTHYKLNTTDSQLKEFFLSIGKNVLSKSVYVAK